MWRVDHTLFFLSPTPTPRLCACKWVNFVCVCACTTESKICVCNWVSFVCASESLTSTRVSVSGGHMHPSGQRIIGLAYGPFWGCTERCLQMMSLCDFWVSHVKLPDDECWLAMIIDVGWKSRLFFFKLTWSSQLFNHAHLSSIAMSGQKKTKKKWDPHTPFCERWFRPQYYCKPTGCLKFQTHNPGHRSWTNNHLQNLA